MKLVVIENVIVSLPFRELCRHPRFAEAITNEVIDGWRTTSYFVPIAQPRRKGQKQSVFDTEWVQNRSEENKGDPTLPLWILGLGNCGSFGRRKCVGIDDRSTANNVVISIAEGDCADA